MEMKYKGKRESVSGRCRRTKEEERREGVKRETTRMDAANGEKK